MITHVTRTTDAYGQPVDVVHIACDGPGCAATTTATTREHGENWTIILGPVDVDDVPEHLCSVACLQRAVAAMPEAVTS